MHNNYPVGHELLTQKLERICMICDNYKICIIESIILPYFPNFSINLLRLEDIGSGNACAMQLTLIPYILL